MDAKKIEKFLELAGHTKSAQESLNSDDKRKLGAQLLLSEVLEYVIKGLGVVPTVNGTPILDPEAIEYRTNGKAPEPLEMLDGLADVAYTMYWNSVVFGLRLEEAFDLVCDNNLEKFVALNRDRHTPGPLEPHQWHCDQRITWPIEVVHVEAIKINDGLYAVGKDVNGKVRKPSSYRSVNLTALSS